LKFKNNLFTSKEEGTLNSSILSKISPKENFGDSLAKIIFEDNSKNEQDLTNFYGYYTFDIESHRPNGQVIRATKGSTGESIGLKFLIFSFILDSFKANLMTLNINKNNLFLFIDEAAKLDNKGINSIVEIAKLLNIFVIFAKKEISEFIQSDQIFYMVDSGVIVPYEGSNFINEIWMKDD
jgi:chromosome condensin MukBEF ATPase and DNA-binding subunit MukB